MKNFFKFDDKRFCFILFIIIDTFLFLFSIYCFICKEFKLLLFVILILILIIGFTILIFNEGIHFNYKKEKIIIVKNGMIKTINMKDVKYFNLEYKTTKKGKLIQMVLFDTFDQVNIPTDRVYNNGQVYNFVFYLKNQTTYTVYYGWLYRVRSTKRINKQINHYRTIRENFMKYKNY